jgi:UDP-N-acetylmuramyl pentapeptide phosphotransferase/UDP-N-acetylglucosamine-1-phosphate transferase
MVAGPAVALIVVAPLSNDSTVRLLLDGALVALCANLANLFDRAPGRVAKVSLLAAAVLVAVTAAAPELLGLAVVAGATLALLVPDLRERMMLGDAGANPLGATLGLAVVLTVDPAARTWTLVAVLALNLVSERVSFSRVIDRVPPLRFVDRLGRDTPPG